MKPLLQGNVYPLGLPSHLYDPTLPRFDFVDGQWVKVDPSVKQEPNPSYVDTMYEDLGDRVANPEYVDAPVLEAWFGFPKKEDS